MSDWFIGDVGMHYCVYSERPVFRDGWRGMSEESGCMLRMLCWIPWLLLMYREMLRCFIDCNCFVSILDVFCGSLGACHFRFRSDFSSLLTPWATGSVLECLTIWNSHGDILIEVPMTQIIRPTTNPILFLSLITCVITCEMARARRLLILLRWQHLPPLAVGR